MSCQNPREQHQYTPSPGFNPNKGGKVLPHWSATAPLAHLLHNLFQDARGTIAPLLLYSLCWRDVAVQEGIAEIVPRLAGSEATKSLSMEELCSWPSTSHVHNLRCMLVQNKRVNHVITVRALRSKKRCDCLGTL